VPRAFTGTVLILVPKDRDPLGVASLIALRIIFPRSIHKNHRSLSKQKAQLQAPSQSEAFGETARRAAISGGDTLSVGGQSTDILWPFYSTWAARPYERGRVGNQAPTPMRLQRITGAQLEQPAV